MKNRALSHLNFILILLLVINSSCYTTEQNHLDVDLIIVNGLVLTMNPDQQIIEDGVVVIDSSKIIDIGSKELLRKYSGEIIDAKEGIIMPGMINAHTHAAMSVFRSLADDVSNRLDRFIFPLENKMVDYDLVYTGAMHGAIEMVKGGVTTLVDMYLFEEAAAEAIKKVGMRGILTQNIIKYPTADGQNSDELIKRATQFVEKYQDDDLIIPGFAPHAPHTVAKEDLIMIKELSEQYNAPVSIHLAETKEEFDHFQSEENMTPVEYLDSVGLLNNKLLAAHAIYVNQNDIELLKKRDVGISHNMIANIKSAKGVSPALKMYNEGLRIGLGTDGPMSGNTLDIIRQMGYVTTIHKLMNSDRTLMPAYKVVDMATMGGARALHLEDQIGSIEIGKLADIVVVETKSANMVPLYDPYSVLAYSANSSNVQTVVINGKVIVKNRVLKNIDENLIIEKVDKIQNKVKNIAQGL